MPGGPKTKLTPKVLKALKLLYNRGFTDKEAATAIGVTEQTINNWKKNDSKLFESLKDWKLEADLDIEKSLRQRAEGYTCKETKVFKTSDDEIITKEVIKHYPPDPTSMIFWLKNRKPKEWRDKQEIEHDHNFKVVRKEYK